MHLTTDHPILYLLLLRALVFWSALTCSNILDKVSREAMQECYTLFTNIVKELCRSKQRICSDG